MFHTLVEYLKIQMRVKREANKIHAISIVSKIAANLVKYGFHIRDFFSPFIMALNLYSMYNNSKGSSYQRDTRDMPMSTNLKF
jgi:hypothetical protein